MSKLRIPGIHLLSRAKIVRDLEGVSYARQFLDLLKIRFGRFNFNVNEYYNFRIYRFFHDNPKKANEYIGGAREWQLNEALNDRRGTLPAWDKRLFYLLLSRFNISTPIVRAIFLPSTSAMAASDQITLGTEDELRNFLGDRKNYPLFAKASTSEQGLHVLHAVGLDEEGKILTAAGEHIGIDALIRDVINKPVEYYELDHGWLFQEVLEQHPEVTRVTHSPHLSCARIVMVRSGREFHPVEAVWKICSEDNVTDHFRKGVTGNMVGLIDIDSGSVSQVLRGFWPEALLAKCPEKLNGFTLPDWQNAIQEVKKAAAIMPSMNVQHWDVAFTTKGPSLIEVNDLGACGLLQLHGSGIAKGELLKALLRQKQKVAMLENSMNRKQSRLWLEQYQWINGLESVDAAD